MMKRRLLGILLLLTVLAGCTQQQPTEPTVPAPDPLVGSWKTELELADEVQQMLTQPEELDPYFGVRSYPITVYLHFYEDGTYRVQADETTARMAFDALVTELDKALEALLQDRIQAADPFLSPDMIQNWTGISIDEVRQQAVAGLRDCDPTAYILEQAAATGNYETRDGILYLSLGVENGINPAIWDAYALSSDMLILMSHRGERTIAFWEGYPLIFTRVTE